MNTYSGREVEFRIEKLINKGLGGEKGVYVHLSGTKGYIMVRIYGVKLTETLMYESVLLEELGEEGFASMVVLDVSFS